MKDKHLQAVHDDDLDSLLISLKVYDDVTAGKCNCVFCKKVVSLDNLGAILPFDGQIAFSCDNPVCLKTMSEVGENIDSI